ncbi:ABC transporter permease [Agrobacterium larrymoorei]|uniref:Peptide/nickel transport system permease protein n=1 Tax=Agrobacterium larrymoorei TaxID=160699 RepID=A0ABU0UGZ3_9HYPH|nr:ABC transporter permease [Agrobacterium larrymoorei]MDQ1184212.1 peptide/nickel transport system permease protein [Agrobacterium larrymoorei]
MSSLLSRLLRHPSGCVGAAIVLTYLLLALAAWLGLTPYDPLQQFRIDRLQGPSAAHWMGTDMFGRDVLSRLMIGIGQSFLVAFSSVGIAAVIGTVLGLTAAWVGHLWDGVVMRLMDILLAFPAILLALLFITVVGPGTFTSILAIAFVYTPIFTRVVRGPALSIKARDFVDAARTFGSFTSYILTRHLMLNLVAPLTVQVTLALAWSLLTESGLSFLGLGTQPPDSSLGLMLADSINLMEMAPWLLIFPGLAVMLGILGFNLLGDALRDLLDPRMRRVAS